MNAAISRGLPAAAQSLDSGSHKRGTGTSDLTGFRDALKERQGTEGDNEKTAANEETGWRPIRWTVPHKMNVQEGNVEGDNGRERETSVEISLPAETVSQKRPTENPDRSISLDVAGKAVPIDENGANAKSTPQAGDIQRTNEAKTQLSENPAANTTPIPATLVAGTSRATTAQPNPQGAGSSRERTASIFTSNRSERPVPETANATAKVNGALGEKAFASAVEQPTNHAIKGEAVQRGEGLMREGLQQQQPDIRVVSIQRVPAPAPLAGNEQAGGTQRAAASESPHLQATQQGEAGRMVQTLKIQLQPAELGMVTARLRIVADQLTVDLQVENAEARQRLSTDSDSIVKALRSLGYEIDRVNVQQSAPGGQSNTATGGSGRDGAFQSMNNGESDGDRSHGAGDQRSSREQERHKGRQAQDGGDAARGGLYI
ncbi:flagellar hook-length control protein FliK [uncultured Nitratireductor sp.]|uniref:flagellar hook-length control protein FliK n=1 Tax=uncultured Nitratireductor sp. TaxID=520953 RepID=UPI0025FC0D1D|nr:flagellar hook-length control protein FliK [uncultured Nitratireductor sp.]